MQFGSNKIGGKYAVGPKIGSGSFGEVYLVNEYGTSNVYALKKQDEKSKHLQLFGQYKILKYLQGCGGFGKVYWQGNQYKSNLMVMDLLGPSLEDLFIMCDKKFTLKTTLMLADQLIQRIEVLHSKNYIHRDIKPENFLMGLGKASHLAHLIDFGLSKKYRDLHTHQHIPYKENKTLTGTARYASVNAHLGIEESRRDDLQSIGYLFIYFLQGFLPWQGVRANNKMEKYQKIMEKKLTTPIEIQCKNMPLEFSIYLSYCRSLKFEDTPNYPYLRNLFLDLMDKQDIKYDFDYDWCHLDAEKQMEGSKIKIEIRQPINFDSVEGNSGLFQNINSKEKVENISAIDLTVEDGEENIIDDEFNESENDLVLQKHKIEGDLEEKKNKLIYNE